MLNYQIYPRKFFSGSDAYIFFNNKIVEQIFALEINMSEPVIPIYGYASYTYDSVARGARIVQGRFKINFTENLYLYTVLDQIKEDKEKTEPKIKEITYSPSNLNAEKISHLLKNNGEDKITEIVKNKQQKIWDIEEDNKYIDKYKHPYFTSKMTSNKMKKDGFDIIITLGNDDFFKQETIESIPPKSKIINGVQLTGVSQIIEPTGQTIYEEYSFIARDLDNTINIRK